MPHRSSYMKSRFPLGIMLAAAIFLLSGASLKAQKASAEFIAKIKPARLISGEQAEDGIKNVFYQDQKLYITNIWSGLQIVDVSNVHKPVELGSYTTENRSHNCYVEDNHAFLSSELDGVQIIDVSNPSRPTPVGRIRTKGDVQWVVTAQPYVYTAEERQGIAVYDVTDMAHPAEVGRFDTPGFAWGLFLDGTTLYVADKSGGLFILDVSNPAQIKRLGQFANMRNAKTVQVEGNFAYVSNGGDGLSIIDVSNKAYPKLIAKVPSDGYIFDAFKFGSNVFMANETRKRLDIVGVEDPAHPQIEGHYQARSKIYSSWKNDVYVYVAADSGTIILRHNHPPVITAIPNQKVDENTLLAITPEASDPDGDAIFFKVKNLPQGAVFDSSTGQIQWTPTYDQSGTYPDVTLTVEEKTESHLTGSTTFDIIVKHVNRPPVLADIPDTTINEEQMLTFTIPEGSDPDVEDKGRLKYHAENLPDGAVFNEKLRAFRWTPTYEQSGVYTVDFVVSDPPGALMRDGATIVVNHVDRKPVLAAVKPVTADENTTITFTLKGQDPDKEDQDKLSYRAENLPEGAVFDPQSATFTWTPTYDQSGTYQGITFIFQAGALSDTQLVDITVNHVNRAPQMEAIADKSLNENDSLSFQIVVSDPDKEDDGKLTVTADHLPVGATFDAATRTFRWTPNYEQSGVYDKITFTVTDPSGLSASQKARITVNHVNRSPQLAPLTDITTDENKPVKIELQGSDPDIEDKSNLTYSVDKLPEGATLNGAVFEWTPTYDQSGVYPLTFTVKDAALEASQSVTITVNHVNRPPVWDDIAAQTVDENKTLSFTVSGKDPDVEDAGKTTLSASQLPEGAVFDPQTGTFTWTPTFEQSGVYTVTFSISDPQGLTTTRDVPITVNHVNRTPVFPEQAAQTVKENAPLTVTLAAASDPDKEDAGKLVYKAENLPPGASFDAATQTFNWTPTYEQSGAYTVTFAVTDGAFTVKQPMTITVENVNLPPELKRVEPQTIDENSPWKMTLDATDPDKEDAGKLTVTVSGLPQGASFDAASRTISWTPGFDQAGVYDGILVSVTDAEGLKDEMSFSITVNNINRKPELNVPGSQQTDENKTLSFQVTATDPDKEDADKLNISMEGAPQGATFSNGQFEWTPGFDQAGQYDITFIASDGTDETRAVVSVTVNNVNRAPQIEGPSSAETVGGSAVSLKFNATDPDEDAITYSLQGAPAGMSIANDGTLSWTPADTESGQFTVTVNASDGSDSATTSCTITVSPKPVPAAPADSSGQ